MEKMSPPPLSLSLSLSLPLRSQALFFFLRHAWIPPPHSLTPMFIGAVIFDYVFSSYSSGFWKRKSQEERRVGGEIIVTARGTLKSNFFPPYQKKERPSADTFEKKFPFSVFPPSRYFLPFFLFSFAGIQFKPRVAHARLSSFLPSPPPSSLSRHSFESCHQFLLFLPPKKKTELLLEATAGVAR